MIGPVSCGDDISSSSGGSSNDLVAATSGANETAALPSRHFFFVMTMGGDFGWVRRKDATSINPKSGRGGVGWGGTGQQESVTLQQQVVW